MPITSPAISINGAKATVAPRPTLTNASLALFRASVILPLAELATISKPVCALPLAFFTAAKFSLNLPKLPLTRGNTAAKPSISVKIFDSCSEDVAPLAVRRFNTPDSPSVLRIAALFAMPYFSSCFCASPVGLSKLTIACLVPDTAEDVWTPLAVTVAIAAATSSNETPAALAIGAMLPSCPANCPIVVLPLS